MMRTTVGNDALVAPFMLILAALSLAGEPVYPVKVSENGRYFVDQKLSRLFRALIAMHPHDPVRSRRVSA